MRDCWIGSGTIEHPRALKGPTVRARPIVFRRGTFLRLELVYRPRFL